MYNHSTFIFFNKVHVFLPFRWAYVKLPFFPSLAQTERKTQAKKSPVILHLRIGWISHMTYTLTAPKRHLLPHIQRHDVIWRSVWHNDSQYSMPQSRIVPGGSGPRKAFWLDRLETGSLRENRPGPPNHKTTERQKD